LIEHEQKGLNPTDLVGYFSALILRQALKNAGYFSYKVLIQLIN